MLISFTQTYGDNRKHLLDIYSRDEKLIEFKNLFDVNIYSFNNCSGDTITYFNSINKVKNTKILLVNGSYTQSIRQLINYLDELKCTHLFFSQDDTFSYDNDNINFKELVDYVKGFDNNFMYNLYYNSDQFKEHISLDKIKELNNLNIFDNNSLNFS